MVRLKVRNTVIYEQYPVSSIVLSPDSAALAGHHASMAGVPSGKTSLVI